MIPFCRQVHNRTHRRVIAVTSAQAGKTDNLLDVIGARLDQRPAPIIYVGPSREFVTDQFEPRLMELLDQAPTLASKVVRGRRMKKTLKWVAGVRVRLASAASSTALKSDPAALGIVDEIDEMMANIRGQGDPLGLVEARGETYADFVTAVVSTPSNGLVETETDEVSGLEFWAKADVDQVQSPIWRLWQSGTRHHFAWPCPHCDEHFVPRFKHLWWPKNATPAQARREAMICCPHCGSMIDDDLKAGMIAGGVQIAPGQTIDDARSGSNEPDNSTWSCWTSGLCSPFVTWGQRAESYLAALGSGEPDKMQTVMNANFGECYSTIAASDQPDWEEIKQRMLPYVAGEAPVGVMRVVMGVDVQRFSLPYVIRGYGERGTSWLLEHGQLFGPTDQDDVWDALSDRMLSPIAGMHIEKVGIDSGFRPDKPDGGNEHKVYEFARRYPWLVVPTKGKDVQSPPFRLSKIEVKPDGRRARYSIQLAWLSTDYFKSLVQSKIRTPMGAPGAFYVPSDVDEDYCKQVTSEVRTLDNGKPKWLQRSRQNHFLDAEAIAEAMAFTLNVQRIPLGMERNQSDEEVDDDDPSPFPAGPIVHPERMAAATTANDRRSRAAMRAARMNR